LTTSFISSAVGAACLGSPSPTNPSPAQVVPGGPPAQPSTGPLTGLPPIPFISPPTPTPEPIELRFAHWETDAAGAVLTAAVKAFQQAAPRVVIREEVTAFGTLARQLTASKASGQTPDVYVDSGAYFFDHVEAGVPLELSALATASKLDPNTLWTDSTTQTSDGRLYALPLWCADELVYVNLDVLNRAGVTAPPSSWTWDDFLALAQKLTFGKPGQVQRWGTYLVNDVVGGWGSLVASNGGGWIDVAQRKTALGPESIEALQWSVDAIHVHHVAPDPTEQQRLTRAGQLDPFLHGDVPLFLSGTWEMPVALAAAKFSWDVLPIPRSTHAKASATLATAQPGCIAGACAHPAEAWEFLQFLISDDVQRTWTKGKVRLPSLRSVAADPATGYAAAPPAHAAIASAGLATGHDGQFVPRWQAWRAAVVATLEPAFIGRVLLAEAVPTAIANGDAALKTR
jgi:multiple sugar transport system substrate-binding protein